MPYHKVKKHKSCPTSKPMGVVKDNDGKLMGCHSSDAKANKQLAALYAAEGRSMSQIGDLLRKVIETFNPYLDENPQGYEDYKEQLDKPQPERMMVRSQGTIQRQGEDSYRLFSVSAVAAVNRIGEIDSRDLFDDFVKRWQESGENPRRDFMHLGKWTDDMVTGEIEFVARDNNALVTVTRFNGSPLAQAEIQSRIDNPDYWGDSIEYLPLGEPEFIEAGQEVIPVYRSGELKFVSTVPEKLAASLFTTGDMKVEEVGRMWNDLSESTRAELSKLMGEEAAQKLWEGVDAVNRQVEEEELVTRTQEEGKTEVAPEPETKAEQVAEIEVNLNDDAMTEIVRQVAASDPFKALLDPVMARLAEIGKAIEAIQTESEKAGEELQERLSRLESEDEAKMDQYFEDLPVQQRINVNWRPRENANDPSNGPSMTSTERVQAALDDNAVPGDKYYES